MKSNAHKSNSAQLLCRWSSDEHATLLSGIQRQNRLPEDGYPPGSASASGLGDTKAVVRVGNPKDHLGAVGPVLPRYSLRWPSNGVERAEASSGSIVPQTPPDLLRRFGTDTPGVLSARDFSAIATRAGHGRSPAGACGASPLQTCVLTSRHSVPSDWHERSPRARRLPYRRDDPGSGGGVGDGLQTRALR